MRAHLTLGAAALLLAACGQGGVGSDGLATLSAPPPFVVHQGFRAELIAAYTYCYRSGCSDGTANPATATRFGPGDELLVTSPFAGWSVQATFHAHDQRCARVQQVDLEEVDAQTYRLLPAGRAGDYDVDLFASGPGGDAISTIVWTTSVDGPLAVPYASAAILAQHDGRVDSYGVELDVTHLATQPSKATAAITVTASNGAAIALNPMMEQAPGGGPCPTGAERAEGTVSFRLDATAGQQAAALGTAPFRYDVVLVLDGVTYRATARWPDDELPDGAPNVKLSFDPPLPALA